MFGVFVIKDAEAEHGRSLKMCELPELTFGVLTPVPYTPEEVVMTLFFRTVYEAEYFMGNHRVDASVGGLNAWVCKSPHTCFTHCQYDVLVDPMMDSCLYCGQPQERK